MALAERAELVARLSLKDDFSGRLGAATGRLRAMEGSLGRISKLGRQGLGAAATNLTRIGVAAGGFVALNVKQGISSLAELEDATTAVDGAIKQLGLTGRLTSQQVAGWANEIERDVQAAFDDKAITQAATTLIRFGKVSETNLRPALVVMTDLAAKTGDVDSAASLLAKALADPEKAAGKLARTGIVLTKQQQDQIKAMVAAGKTTEAQTFLLQQLEKATKGAAAASAGPYRDSLNILKDVTEDAQRALGEAFLPLLTRVADKLSTSLADPKVIEQIRDFGKNIAGGFDKLLEIGSRIPWAQIGDSMKIAGAGAKALFDAFTMLPPWVQTAVLTGWGLNKLTGGALGGIVGELGKGLIRGVLGMNAGVVNINAGVVRGGGVPGAAGAPAAAAGGGALALTAAGLLPGIAALVTGLLADEANKSPARTQLGVQGELKATTGLDINAITNLGVMAEAIPKLLNAINNPTKPLPLDPRNLSEGNREVVDAVASSQDRMEAMRIALTAKLGATQTAINNNRTAIDRNRTAVVSSGRTGDREIVAAIKSSRPILRVSVNVSNSVRTTVYRTGTTINRTSTGVRGALLGM